MINLTSKHSSLIDHIIRQTHFFLQFVNNNSNFSTIIKLSSASHQLLRDIVQFLEHISEKNLVFTDWTLYQKFFNIVIRTVTREATDFAEWLEKRKKIYKQFRSSLVDAITKTSRTSQSIRSTTLEISFRNKNSSKELIRVLFKLSKNLSSKMQTTQIFLRKNKRNHSADQFKNVAESFAEFFTESLESSQNFAKSFKNNSLSERTRNEMSKTILQKLKNRHSKVFKDHKELSQSIISSSSNEADMTKQQQQNRSNQNIQNMIQVVIREMMSKII